MANVSTDLKSRSVTVILAPALLRLFPDAPEEIDIEATTVSELLNDLERRFPGMKDRLCDSSPKIRRHINIFVEGERARLSTPLKNQTQVYILTAISGG